MRQELDEDFKDLSLKQLRFLQEFVGSKDSEPDILVCMKSAGYKGVNRPDTVKAGKKILAKFSNNNKVNFQRLLSYSITDIDVVGKLYSLLHSEDEKVSLSALKLIATLKGYDDKQESHAGSTIVIEIIGENNAGNADNPAITTIDTAALQLPSD